MSNPKPQSLAAAKGAIPAPTFQMPSVFARAPDKMAARHIAPYIVFSHPKRADEWQKIVAKYGQAEEGNMYLVKDGDIVHLPVAKISWLCHKQYWAHVNAAGTEVIGVSLDEKPPPYKEHVEAVVLLYAAEGVVPCNIMFRTTKCPAAKVMSDTLIEASSVSWADISQAHKDSMVCQQPFMRFYGDITLGDRRTGKESGMPYRPTRCEVKPTGPVEWRMLKAFVEHADTQKAMDEAAARFEQRTAEALKKLAK